MISESQGFSGAKTRIDLVKSKKYTPRLPDFIFLPTQKPVSLSYLGRGGVLLFGKVNAAYL